MIYISAVLLSIVLSVYIIVAISNIVYGIAACALGNIIWKYNILIGVLMLVILFGIGLSNSAHAQTSPIEHKKYYVGQAEVHDGDTLKINGQSFRLAGVDAPELSELYGIASRDMLIVMIRDGTVICTPTGTHSYKRLVAICGTKYYDDLGAELIHRGLALDCEHYSHGKYRELEPKDIRKKLIPKGYCK